MLKAKQKKPKITTIMLSVDNKLDHIRLSRASQRSLRDLCVFVLAETAVQPDRLTLHRADRGASLYSKLWGGGRAVYANKSWCQDTGVVSKFCSPHREFMIVKC